MSTATVAPIEVEGSEDTERRPSPSLGRSMRRVRRVGYVVLGIQLVALLVWSSVRADRFALTWDFSVYHQAWWLIGHGHLNPYDSAIGMPYWSVHGEFFMWLLALPGLVWPHAVTLLWAECLTTVGAEAVAFGWLCDMAVDRAGTRADRRVPVVLAWVGLVLLVFNPWIYWSLSFDFHYEPVGILFVLLAARDLYRDPGRRRVWVWVVLALLCGDVVATYVVAIGLSAVLAGPRWRRNGLLVAAAGLVWVLLLTVMGANRGSDLAAGYGYLAAETGVSPARSLGLTRLASGLLHHPQRIAAVLWDRRLDLYANFAPSGLVGVLSPWVAVVAVLVLLENALYTNSYLGFIVPGFQGLLLFVLLPVGTVGVLAGLARRRPGWAVLAAAIVSLNAIGWAAVWVPRTSSQWLRVSPAAAGVLSSVKRQIPSADEVVVSQGVAGRFSGRQWVYSVFGPGSIPVRAPTVWAVIAPSQGIETTPVDVSEALIAELAGPLHATQVAGSAGIWAFRWTPAPGTRTLTVPRAVPTVAGWTAAGPAGRAVTEGPAANWRAVATGRAGYVVSGDYRRVPPGRYQATVVASTTVPVNVEVWNATGGVLLARRSVPSTNGLRAVSLEVDARRVFPEPVYGGVGPFAILPVGAPSGNQLEIRVWTPGGGLVSVASLELERSAG